jgi:ribosomal protein S18 acetylase RimI-like enzyme
MTLYSRAPAAPTPTTTVERVSELSLSDLHDLYDAAAAAIADGGGFGWLAPPDRDDMITYWKGVLLVPERDLLIARLDGVIAGSAQLQRSPRNNEAQALVCTLTTFFVAPWARGHGLAPQLVQGVEDLAKAYGLKVLTLDVRATQTRAIEIYERSGYVHWGTNPRYALVDGTWVTGYYYSKDLDTSDAAFGDRA